MTDERFVTVWFTDGHRQRWPLPSDQTADGAIEELRRVIISGQWFRVPETNKMYSPYAIVAVEVVVADPDDTEPPGLARRLGEVVADAISPDDRAGGPSGGSEK